MPLAILPVHSSTRTHHTAELYKHTAERHLRSEQCRTPHPLSLYTPTHRKTLKYMKGSHKRGDRSLCPVETLVCCLYGCRKLSSGYFRDALLNYSSAALGRKNGKCGRRRHFVEGQTLHRKNVIDCQVFAPR